MARPSERRAALERFTSTQRAAVVDISAEPTEDETPMKIQSVSVDLHKALPRLDAGRGQATQDTTRFNVSTQGVGIEFDTATQLVRISKGTAYHDVPIHGVERLGMTLEGAAIHAKAQAQLAEEKRLANEAAAAAAEAIANRPA